MPVQQRHPPVRVSVNVKRERLEPRGPGGGGGGGGPISGGGKFSSDEVAKIFLQLRKASLRFFSGENNWLISDKSAGDLLAGTFELLAQATVEGQLPFIAEQMARQAPSQRAESQRHLDQRAGIGHPPVFSEAESKDILKKIRDCLLPDTPK